LIDIIAPTTPRPVMQWVLSHTAVIGLTGALCSTLMCDYGKLKRALEVLLAELLVPALPLTVVRAEQVKWVEYAYQHSP
jgi:hypothetical protein